MATVANDCLCCDSNQRLHNHLFSNTVRKVQIMDSTNVILIVAIIVLIDLIVMLVIGYLCFNAGKVVQQVKDSEKRIDRQDLEIDRMRDEIAQQREKSSQLEVSIAKMSTKSERSRLPLKTQYAIEDAEAKAISKLHHLEVQQAQIDSMQRELIREKELVNSLLTDLQNARNPKSNGKGYKDLHK